jgi:hypothetical protein
MKPAVLKNFQAETGAIKHTDTAIPAAVPDFLQKKWIYHTVFWIVYFVFICLAFYSSSGIQDLLFYIQISAFMPLSIALVYLNIYILIPALLYRKKYVYYALSLILSLFVMAFLDQLIKKLYVHYGYPIFSYTSGLDIKSLFSESVSLFYLTGFP